jgi:hypothetical protein
MGASFAKAVMPRSPKRREPARESDWSLGWVLPLSEDAPLPEADLPSPPPMHEGEGQLEDRS